MNVSEIMSGPFKRPLMTFDFLGIIIMVMDASAGLSIGSAGQWKHSPVARI